MGTEVWMTDGWEEKWMKTDAFFFNFSTFVKNRQYF